jgi:hypothetical protein
MTRADLEQLLSQERVRPDAYSLYGEVPDECLCLLPEPGGWTVFYSERGERTGPRHFETEAEACDFIAMRLLADPGNRLQHGGPRAGDSRS